MGQVLHGRATTTHAIRAAIQRSKASLQALIERYGINPKTVAKWRRRTSLEGIYGLEESRGVTALVMELVAGEDLLERIERGAIPIDETLPMAKQIAEPLEAGCADGQSFVINSVPEEASASPITIIQNWKPRTSKWPFREDFAKLDTKGAAHEQLWRTHVENSAARPCSRDCGLF